MRLGQAEAGQELALKRGIGEVLLVRTGKVPQHQDLREVADDGVFVLQIIVQAKALAGEMLADNGHAEIGAVLAAKFLGQRIAQMAGRIGAALGLPQQRLPFRTRQTAIFEIGPRPFAAVVEETDIVVLLFERLDFVFDELVEHHQIVGNFLRDIEVHVASPPDLCLFLKSLDHEHIEAGAHGNLCRGGKRRTKLNC